METHARLDVTRDHESEDDAQPDAMHAYLKRYYDHGFPHFTTSVVVDHRVIDTSLAIPF
jgi:hypothetical protein